MVASALLVGVVLFAFAFATTALAADCTITSTLRVGSKGEQVKCLQTAVGATADGKFGPKTKAAVMAWQSDAGLAADGVFGPKSRAAWSGGAAMTSAPAAGCEGGAMYNSNTGAPCAATTPVAQTGPVTVAVAADNPASRYIIGGQSTADLAHFTFSGAGTVNTVMLKRTGVSDQNTLSNLYLYDGTTRLTDGYSFNNTGELTMNSLGLAVSGSRTISVKADVAVVTNASTLGITLLSFTAAGQTAVTANVSGNTMTYGSGNLASVYLATQASVAVPAASVNAGTSAYTVWSAPVQVNVREVWLKGANFRTVGSAPVDALGNVKLYVDGVNVGSAATMGTITGSNYAMFDFSASPLKLSTGTHTVDVRADIVKGASYTVTVSVQQASDLVLYDGQVGVNLAAAVSSTTAFTANTAGQITINAGSASVNVDPTFQALTNITGGATNVAIGKFKVHGYGEDVKVSNLIVKPIMTSGVTASGSTTNLNNVTIYFNGSQVGSSAAYNGTDALTFQLGSQMILPAGADSYIEIRADLQNSTSINYTAGSVSANLNVGSSNGQGQNSKATLNFPTSTVTGTILTVQTGVLAVSRNTGYASQNANPNTAGVKVGSFVLQNQSSSESVRVTSLAVTLFNGAGTALSTSTTPALTNFSNLRTSETTGSGANPIQPAASNTFSVDFTLLPGATKVIDVLADTGATAGSASVLTKLVVTSIGSSSNVSISQNGNATAVTGQTVTLAVGTVSNNIALLTAPSTSQQFVPAANGGAANATKAVFKIQATGGSAVISEMKFTVNSQDFSAASTDADANTTTAQTLTLTTSADTAKFAVGDVVQLVAATTNGLGTVTAISAPNLTVYVAVASTGTPSAVRLVPSTVTAIKVGNVSAAPVAGVSYLTGLALTVPNGGSGLSQEVFVSYAEVGTNGISTGATARVALEYIKYTSGNTTSTLCTAAIQTCDTVQTAATVAAPTMKLVGSAPTMTLTTSTQVLTTGSVQIGNVVVTANLKGDITLNALPINAILTSATLPNANPGYAADGIRVKDKDGNPVTTTNTAMGSTTAGGTSTITFTGGYQIPAGTSQTFKIFLQFDAVTSTNKAGQATLSTGNADLLSWTDTAGNAATTNGIDVAGSAATTVSNRYLDRTTTTPGFFYNYPTGTVGVSS
ncbi:MAG: cell wall surface anchor family protein [Parcubacteria group bacterium Gr01-1014_24]|nr:MAG: cell wall surface anchor family protein [Parcubacteria group bacterium Gr01-1014_24]